MEKGKFIALEGIDGSGKSTQIGRLARRIEALGLSCRTDCEPTGRPAGVLIRQALTGQTPMDPRVIAALFAADRLDHLVNEENGVCAAIARGITVITDRYYFSSYAYQGADVGMDWVIEANKLSAQLLRPTVTVFLDVPAQAAMERIRRNRDHVELFEKEERLRQTRALYLEAFERLKDVETVAMVDGSGTEDQVAERVWAVVSSYFAKIEQKALDNSGES